MQILNSSRKRFVSNIFSNVYDTTIGLNINTKIMSRHGKDIKLVIWDIAGNSKLGKVEKTYLSGTDAILFVADGIRAKTLDTVINLRDEIMEAKGHIFNLLLINKFDQKSSWEVSETEIQGLRDAKNHVYLTSAKHGLLIEEAFTTVADHLLNVNTVE